MLAEFKHTLRRLKGQIIGWSAGIAIYSILMALFYPNMREMGDMIEDYISIFPEAVLVFFENINALATPMGYLDVYFFSYMHVIVGILAISAGAGLLAGDEEKGVLELVLAQPVSRSKIFWGRLLGLSTALGIVLATGWLSWALPAGSVGMDLSPWQLLMPFLSLFAVLLCFAALALFFSMVLPAARIASMLTGAALVGNYLLLGFSKINDKLQPAMKYTPLRYYQGGNAIEGLKGSWLVGLLSASLLFLAGAWLLFQRRDIRVGGERSWQLPSWKFRRS